MQTTRNNKPMYGIINYFGSGWTVIYRKTYLGNGCWSTNSLNGYGEFPFDEFPDIPVIDYRDNNAVLDALKANLNIIECSTYNRELDNLGCMKTVRLKEYLEYIQSLDIRIYRMANQLS